MDEYMEFLEECCRYVAEEKPKSIAFVTLNADGAIMCAYLNAGVQEKALIAGMIQQDGIMERIQNNPAWLRETLETEEEEQEE